MERTGEWLLCPACSHKTRTQVRQYTKLLFFPLYCPKCKKESLVNVEKLNISIVEEPDTRCSADNK
jgi:ribosomal protein L44E